MKSESRFCRQNIAEYNNTKINFSLSIPFIFLLFKDKEFPLRNLREISFSDKFSERQFFTIVNV